MKYSVFAHGARALGLLVALTGFVGFQSAQAQQLSTLMFFNGSRAMGGVTLGADGALYGIGSESNLGVQGGAVAGLLYRVTTDATQVSTFHQFGRLGQYNGGGPRGGLIRDAAGNLYGVTAYTSIESFAPTGNGTVFKITPAGVYTRLHTFGDYTSTTAPPINPDGAAPNGALLLANDGFLYGTAFVGGANGTGTLFKVATDGTGFAVLHSFAASTGGSGDSTDTDPRPINVDGAFPQVPLIQGSDGNLYGTAFSGGSNGTGTIFSLHRDGTGFTVLRSFDASPPTITDVNDPNFGAFKTNASGAYPRSGLLLASNGLLYGTTSAIGPSSYGTLYRISTDGSNFKVLWNFDAVSGGLPQGELITALDGTIVGTTSAGGAQTDGTTGAGSIYSVALDASTFNNLYIFGSDGASPGAGVVQTSDGSFYGTTTAGSPYGAGTVFKFGPAVNKLPLGTPVPVDNNSGAISWESIVLLLLFAGLRFQMKRAALRTAPRRATRR